MGTHVEEFRLSTSTRETVYACHRALRSLEWNEQSSDRLVVRLLEYQDRDLAAVADWLHKHIPIARPVIDRYAIRTVRAPEGPPRADAEINAVLGRQAFIVRISLREHGGFGTDVTISGSDLGSPWTGPLRSAIGKLRGSLEVQSGSPAPSRPPTQ
jgi:hypothetical protein